MKNNEIQRHAAIRQHDVQMGASHRTDSNRTDSVLACEKGDIEVIHLFGNWYLSADEHCFELKSWDGVTFQTRNGVTTNAPQFGRVRFYYSDINALIKKIFYISLREKIGEGYEVKDIKELKQMIEESVNIVEMLSESIIPDLPER